MLRIGEFSRIGQVSVKTLRYYDTVGLLKPIVVDPATGYRYYAFEMLPKLNRILALKELGLSLEQIKQLLNDGLSAEQLRGMLKLKQVEIQQQMADEQEKLARVEARQK
jgi:DNA-binding transcriptional MerR regulator